MSQSYIKIYLHPKVTIDSLMATALLRLFSPHAAKAQIQVIDALPEGTTVASLDKEKVLAVGFPIGQFPYQVVEKRYILLTPRVAEALQLHPFLQQRVAALVQNEMFNRPGVAASLAAGNPQSTALSQLLQTLRQQTALPAEQIVVLFLPLVEAYVQAEQNRVKALEEEYKSGYAQGRIEGLTVYQGKKLLRLVFIQSSLDGMADWLFANADINADLVVQQLPKGYYLIFTKPGRDIKLLDVISVLRIEEARAKHIPFDRLDRKRLTATGRLEGVEEWYYNSAVNSINNGSFYDRRTAPTKLSLPTIKQALTIGLNFSALAPECPRHSCIYKKCSWYPYNFFRCHKIRKYGDKALIGITTADEEINNKKETKEKTA